MPTTYNRNRLWTHQESEGIRPPSEPPPDPGDGGETPEIKHKLAALTLLLVQRPTTMAEMWDGRST